MSKQSNNLTPNNRIGFLTWLEWLVIAGIVLVAAAAVFTTFFSDTNGQGTVISQFASRADALDREPDPIRRDSMCIPLSAFGRSIDAQIPTNARVFLLNMLGPENQGNLGYYYFLNNYLYPREVAISLGTPPKFVNQGVEGRSPTNAEELAQAGYDLVLKQGPEGGWQPQVLRPLSPRPPEDRPGPISKTDTYISFLLPLAVALVGTRLVRWLFADLIPVLTTGELLASGLAVGMFLLTQFILLLRILGARLEWFIGMAIFIWALVEIVLLVRNRKSFRAEFNARYLWWLLLIPAAVVFWQLFRLAGLEGMSEYDAIAHWEFKGKLLYYTSGNEIWKWTSNPAYGYAILNNPLTVSLLYTFQWGVLGHINEFVIKLWNQWMLLLLVFAILGAGQFGGKRSWLTAATATIIVLLPITLLFARWEGSTIPFFFYVVLASMQLALGLAENEPGRLRLGLFIFMGSAMVKLDGGFLFGICGLLLLLDKQGRTVLWPVKKIGIAGLVGLIAWLPFFYFRAHALGHFNDKAPQLVMQNLPTAAKAAPMVWLELILRRLFNNDFASWTSPDNHHAIWSGKWMGLQSFADGATLGLGWVCLLALFYFLLNGQRLRRVALSIFVMSLVYSFVVCITFLGWSLGLEFQTGHFYTRALSDSDAASGGRYLYPVFMSCFVAGSILLSRRRMERLPDRIKK
jgi:hypothetical protein